MTRIHTLLSASLLALAITSCQSTEPESPAPANTPEAAESPTETSAPEPSDGVAYEPAYPADVSSEDLSEQDVDQQGAGHEPGDDDHSHDDGSHSHDDEEEHEDHGDEH